MTKILFNHSSADSCKFKGVEDNLRLATVAGLGLSTNALVESQADPFTVSTEIAQACAANMPREEVELAELASSNEKRLVH